jgi:hypothetical protein
MSDTFAAYKRGVTKLVERMGRDHPRLSDLLVYQHRLMENIEQVQRYGDTETRRADRAQIVDSLNQLALETVDVTFNELCRLDLQPDTAVTPPPTTNTNYHIHITGGQGIVIGDRAQVTTNIEQSPPRSPNATAIPRRFHTGNIRKLLIHAFTERELLELIYDEPLLRPVYDTVSNEAEKARIVHALIEYADRQGVLSELLEMVEMHNNVQYEKHRPYTLQS